jgi:hypothetical protein
MVSDIVVPSFPGSQSSQSQNLLAFVGADVRGLNHCAEPSRDNVLQRDSQRSSDLFHGGQKDWLVDFSLRNTGKKIYGTRCMTASDRDFTEVGAC